MHLSVSGNVIVSIYSSLEQAVLVPVWMVVDVIDWRTCAVNFHSRQQIQLVIMKLPVVIVCLLLRVLTITADGVYSCPSGCRCTILKRQRDRDRATVASSEQSAAPGRKVVCQSSSPLITSISQIPLDNLPKDTLHLYVVLCFILFLYSLRIFKK